MELIMPGLFGDNFLSLLSPSATAQYRTTPAATFPNAPTPGPLSIPPAQPPIFLSPTDSSAATPAQATGTLGGIGQGLASGINNHALTLMALGAGIAEGGIGRGLAAATTTAETERNRQMQQLSFLQTYNALTAAGVPSPQAQAAISNPSLMRALAAKYLGPRSPTEAYGQPPFTATASVNQASPSAPNGPAPNLQENRAQSVGGGATPPAQGLPALPAAIGPEAPVRNAPLSSSNPFDFSFADLLRSYLWGKLMFDSRPLQSNSFFSGEPNPGSDMFNAAPMNPPSGSPPLPPDLR
jgi:hypothetical protein